MRSKLQFPCHQELCAWWLNLSRTAVIEKWDYKKKTWDKIKPWICSAGIRIVSCSSLNYTCSAMLLYRGMWVQPRWEFGLVWLTPWLELNSHISSMGRVQWSGRNEGLSWPQRKNAGCFHIPNSVLHQLHRMSVQWQTNLWEGSVPDSGREASSQFPSTMLEILLTLPEIKARWDAQFIPALRWEKNECLNLSSFRGTWEKA